MKKENPKVNLIWLTKQAPPPVWPLGEVKAVLPAPTQIEQYVQEGLTTSPARFWLFWDSALGNPDPGRILETLERPGDVWHAGLRLGMGGLPQAIDYVAPTWMLNRDPDKNIEATSWRLSINACLIRNEVIQKMGFIRPEFKTLEGAGLELGHRYIRRGVLMRHIPRLVDGEKFTHLRNIPFLDELRFIYFGYGKFRAGWATMRAVITKTVLPLEAWEAWRNVMKTPIPPVPPPFHSDIFLSKQAALEAQISVLIPTLERYPYLRTLLQQLRFQTVPPREIFIVDQTAPEHRDLKITEDFADLPIRLIYLKNQGQCNARNIGLQSAAGEYILLLDDDIEVKPEILALHVENLNNFKAVASSGVAHVNKEGVLAENFTFIRISDVFPAGNTLIKKSTLMKSGLFDLAYNKLPRADGDLGIRVYLSGALMILNPHIGVIHHHAPSGGLRQHKARVITYASSRKSFTQRHLPNKSEIYLAKRYFTSRQVTESLWLRALGTFGFKGPWWQQGLKILISSLLLPDTIRQIQKRNREAEVMLRVYPQIPFLREEK